MYLRVKQIILHCIYFYESFCTYTQESEVEGQIIYEEVVVTLEPGKGGQMFSHFNA